MTMTSTGPINNLNTIDYSILPQKPPKAVPPDSVLKSLNHRLNSPDEKILPKDLIECTICPEDRRVAVTDIAKVFTHVKNPLTGEFFLAPGIYKEIYEAEKMAASGPIRMLLSGMILEALKSFQQVYLGINPSDCSLGYLTPIDCRRILTIDAGIMLTQLTNPETLKPYLDPKEFNNMPRGKQIKMSAGNPIFEAFKDFLRIEKHQEAGMGETPFSIMNKYHFVQKRWEQLKLDPTQK